MESCRKPLKRRFGAFSRAGYMVAGPLFEMRNIKIAVLMILKRGDILNYMVLQQAVNR